MERIATGRWQFFGVLFLWGTVSLGYSCYFSNAIQLVCLFAENSFQIGNTLIYV